MKEKIITELCSASTEDLVEIVRHSFVKIKDVIPTILELRSRFRKLPRGSKIADCQTWGEFCVRLLNRTDRAIRKALAEDREPEEKNTTARPAKKKFECPENSFLIIPPSRPLDTESIQRVGLAVQRYLGATI